MISMVHYLLLAATATPSDAFIIESMIDESSDIYALAQEIAITNRLLGIVIAFLLLALMWKIFSLIYWFIRDFICNNFHF